MWSPPQNSPKHIPSYSHIFIYIHIHLLVVRSFEALNLEMGASQTALSIQP